MVVAAGCVRPPPRLWSAGPSAVLGGAMYSQYRCVEAAQCLQLPDGVTAVEGASCFVNPLTALGHVGTMRLEGHSALVHTAAASNLGQMLNRLCLADGIELVNIVRPPAQEELLRSAGAEHVCNSTAPTFTDDLTAALVRDRCDDRVRRDRRRTPGRPDPHVHGGGAGRNGGGVQPVRLDDPQAGVHLRRARRGPTELTRNFGMAWGIGGWLLMPYLQKVGAEEVERMRQRVATEITTTFASTYTKHVSLNEALSPDAVTGYTKQATGEKYLITPNA